jgi:biopolymer transport protein ExbD
MVTAPLATVSIKIDLPPAKAPPKQPQKPPTYVSINNNGDISVSMSATVMKPTTLQTMATDVAAALAVPNPTTQRIFIRADQKVRYGRFMQVINQLQTDGYFKIGLISEEVQPDTT